MALPVYEALKTRYPGCVLSVLCNYPDLLAENPFVDSVNEPSVSPDLYISLRGAPRTMNRLEHLARLAGAAVPEHAPRLYYTNWLAPLLDGWPGGRSGFVAIAAGTTWPTKRWASERWRALADALAQQGIPAVELGHGHAPVGAGLNLVGQTTVREAACVLRAARVLVCGDSGLMHVALAVGTPVVALFGPTRPDILFRREPGLTAVLNDRECQGCWNASEAPATPGVCPRHIAQCLETIPVETVLRRVKERWERGT